MTKQIVIDSIRTLAEQGKTIKEAALEIGYSYNAVNGIGKKNGIEFRRQENSNKGSRNPRDAERVAAICDRFNDGETLQSIGDIYGITRERVRQIVGRAGMKPRTETIAERDASICAFAKTAETREDLLAQFPNYAEPVIHNVLHNAGIALPKTKSRVDIEREYDRLIKASHDTGKTLFAVCGKDNRLRNAVAYYANANGISVDIRYRPSEEKLAERLQILASVADRSGTLDEYVAAVSANEGRDLAKEAVRTFARDNGFEAYKRLTKVISVKKPRKEKPAKPIRTVRKKAAVEVGNTIKETAIANYGKASAASIAKVLGTSRNSIIGHWFRARQSGLIPANGGAA